MPSCWSLVFPTLLQVLLLPWFPVAGLPGFFVREGDELRLPCSAGVNGGILERRWFRNYITNASPAIDASNMTLFYQQGGGSIERVTARGDISVEAADFPFVFTSARLEDGLVYTCRASSTLGGTTYGYANVTVYVLPELVMSLNKDSYMEGDSVTATCRVPRVSPQLEENDFEMTWGHRLTMSTTSLNPDGTYQYTLTERRTVTTDDNNVNISCVVAPRIGDNVRTHRILNVTSSLVRVVRGAILTMDRQNVNLGDRVILTCLVNQAVSIDVNQAMTSWYHNGELLQQMSALQDLHVPAATPDSPGNYSCHVTDEVSHIATSNKVTLTVKPHQEYVKEVGTSLVLTCDHSSGGPIWQFAWFRGFSHYGRHEDTVLLFDWADGASIRRAAEVRGDITIDEGSFSMTIGQLQHEDSAIYTCHYLNDIDGDVFNYTRVSVKIDPTLTIEASKSIVVEGEEVVITCRVPAVNPALPARSFYMTWGHRFFYPAVIGGVFNNGSYSYHLQHSQRVQREHAGFIFCKVERDEGETLQTHVELRVIYPPEGRPTVMVSRRVAVPGDALMFTCVTDSIIVGEPPLLRARWYRDDQLLGQGFGDDLSVSLLASLELSGQYSCSIGNSAGFTDRSPIIDVHVQPPVQPAAPSGTPTVMIDEAAVNEGETVNLTCDTSSVTPGTPPDLTMIRWYRDGQLLDGQFMDAVTVSLTVKQEDGGSYSCEVGNGVGFTPLSTDKNLQVRVPAPPSGTPVILVDPPTVEVGESVTLTCDISKVMPGEPADIAASWFKAGRKFTSDIRLTLTFIARPDSAGLYSCSVGNGIGETPESPQVTVVLQMPSTPAPTNLPQPSPSPTALPPPELPVLKASKNEFEVGETVSLTCQSAALDKDDSLTVRWFRDGQILDDLKSSPTVSLQMTEESAGTYSCSVHIDAAIAVHSKPVTLNFLKSSRQVSSETSDTVKIIAAAVGGAAAFILVIAILVCIAVRCSGKKHRREPLYEDPTEINDFDTLPSMHAPPPPYVNAAFDNDFHRPQAGSNNYVNTEMGSNPKRAVPDFETGGYVNTDPKGKSYADEDTYWAIRDDDQPRDLRFQGRPESGHYQNSLYTNSSTYSA